MKGDDAFATAFRMTGARVGYATKGPRRVDAGFICRRGRDQPDVPPGGTYRRLIIPVAVLTAAFLVASCLDPEQALDSRGLTLASADGVDGQTANAVSPAEPAPPKTAEPSPGIGSSSAVEPSVDSTETPVSPTSGTSAGATSPGGRRVSLRPMNNSDADDLLDHWGHRHNEALSARLSEASAPDDDIAEFEALLKDARENGAETAAPDYREGDAARVLGHRRGVAYGRWTGGPADTLSLDFDIRTGTIADDRSVAAALERAGKAWSWGIDDTWTAGERRSGETKARLIGDQGREGIVIRVEPGGETSTGVVIYVTGVDLAGNQAGRGGPFSLRPGGVWEPHTGMLALGRKYLEGAGDASLFHTMVHEIGHVLGAWLGEAAGERLAAFANRETGTWTGPNVVAVHGGPAPFQDYHDAHGWHGGERNPDASNIDYAHSGVCTSVMAYCTQSAGIPAFLPAPIDFAFLADLGLTIRHPTDRPETYGLAGWLDYSAFTLSVSRELEVSLADPQPRYSIAGAEFQTLEMVDLLWAEADAFGEPSIGDLARSFPLAGTVRYSGGLIGTAVDFPGFPPVHGDANLSVGLDSLAGKASFTSLGILYNGTLYRFAGGSLHYPIAVEGNGIASESRGISLQADFYGPQHQEVAGTLDDSRAGLVASFGARHDERPDHASVVADADHVRGSMYRKGLGEAQDGWYRFRCGAGSTCEVRGPERTWKDLPAAGDKSPRERVLDWTAGWGEWLSEDMFADHGKIRIVRRSLGRSDGARGRNQEDGYFGIMEHAAFGTGFRGFRDWEGQDGEISVFFSAGTGFQGDLSGSRPAGRATWDGRMVGYQWGLEPGEDPFVQGHASIRVSLAKDRVDIGFSGVRSMDLERELENFGFTDIPVASDGIFAGFEEGPVEGAFFGTAHEEAAGRFHKNDIQVTGSFGAVKRD